MGGILALASVTLVLAAWGRDETLRLGRMEVAVPPGWTGKVEGERIVLSMNGIPDGAIAEIAIEKELKPEGGFRAWFYELWDTSLKDKPVSKKGLPSWSQTNTSQSFIARAELAGGARFVMAAYQTDKVRLMGVYGCSSETLLAKGEGLLQELLKSIRISDANSNQGNPGPPKPGTTGTNPPTGKDPTAPPKPGDTNPAGKPVLGQDTWDPRTAFTGALIDEETRSLVDQVHANDAKSAEALALLMRKMGLTIVTEDKVPIAQPLTQPRLGLMVTDTELDMYRKMSSDGHRVPLSGLFAAIDFNLEKMGSKVHLQDEVVRQLGRNLVSVNPTRRNFAKGLVALGLPKGSDILSAGAGFDPMLDPLQFLLITRAVTEDIRIVVNRLKKESLAWLWTSADPAMGPAISESQDEAIPGWFEDLVVGGTGIIGDKAIDLIHDELSGSQYQVFGQGRNVVTGAAVLLSFVKFAATYACLKGDWKLENAPLPRTKKKTEDNDERTIECKLYFDVPKVLELMKKCRMTLNALGMSVVDVDMPKSEPLADRRVDWILKQGDVRHPEAFCVRWSDGWNPIDRRTGRDGVDRMMLTGLRQRRKLDEKTAKPFMRKVRIVLYPSVKDSGTKAGPQDIADIATGAPGLLAGPTGILNLIFETVYRARWVPAAATDYPVRDWADPGCWTAAWQVTVSGGESVMINDAPGSTILRTWTVDHKLQTYTMVLNGAGTPKPIKFPTQAELARMPPEARAKTIAMMNSPEFQDMINTRSYVAQEEAYQHKVNDSERDDMNILDACAATPETLWSQSSLFWDDINTSRWDQEEILRTYPHKDSPLLNITMKVDLRTGEWTIKQIAFPVLALGKTSSKREPEGKTGLLYVPLIAGEPWNGEESLLARIFAPKGTLPADILAILREPRKANQDKEYTFTSNDQITTVRVFDTNKGKVRQPIKCISKWVFEYHPAETQ